MAQGCGAVVVGDPRHPNGALDFVRDPGEQGLCIPPGPGPMREALEKLLDDPALRLRLRRAAWNRARDYRIETQSRRLLEFYDTL